MRGLPSILPRPPLANALLSGYVKAAENSDPSLLSATLVPTCTRRVAPAAFLASIDMPTDLAFTNEQYEAQFAKELPAARPTRVESIQNVVVDVIKKTAAATSIYTSEFTGGAEETMQFACFLELDDEDKKITKMLEFVDTMTAARYQGLIEKWLKGK